MHSNPLMYLDEKDQKAFFDMLELFTKGMKNKDLPMKDIMYIANHAQPIAESLQKGIVDWLVDSGIDRASIESVLTLLLKLTHISGGVSFQDFTLTEKMSSLLEKGNK